MEPQLLYSLLCRPRWLKLIDPQPPKSWDGRCMPIPASPSAVLLSEIHERVFTFKTGMQQKSAKAGYKGQWDPWEKGLLLNCCKAGKLQLSLKRSLVIHLPDTYLAAPVLGTVFGAENKVLSTVPPFSTLPVAQNGIKQVNTCNSKRTHNEE